MTKTKFDLEREAKLIAIRMIHRLKLGINWIITYKKYNTTALEASIYLGDKLNKLYVPFRIKIDNLNKETYEEVIANELKDKIKHLTYPKDESIKIFNSTYPKLINRLKEQKKSPKRLTSLGLFYLLSNSISVIL